VSGVKLWKVVPWTDVPHSKHITDTTATAQSTSTPCFISQSFPTRQHCETVNALDVTWWVTVTSDSWHDIDSCHVLVSSMTSSTVTVVNASCISNTQSTPSHSHLHAGCYQTSAVHAGLSFGQVYSKSYGQIFMLFHL